MNMFKKIAVILGVALLLFSGTVQAVQIIPDCDPSLPPSQEGACGADKLIILAKNFIKFLLYITIPLAAIMIVWGGFIIMTAGGSEEKVKKGKTIITGTVIGVAIALGAWLIISTITKFFLK